MSAAVEVELVEADRLTALERPWARLLDEQAFPDPTRRAGWLAAWWGAFGGIRGREPLVLAAHAGDRLVGVAPLMRERLPGGLRLVRHLGTSPHWFDPDFLVDPAHPGVRAALAQAVARLPADLVALEDLSAASPTLPALAEAMPGGSVSPQGEFRHRYLAASPPDLRERRKKIGRYLRAADAGGRRVEVEVVPAGTVAGAGLDESLALLARVWRARGDASGVTDPAGRRYLRSALAALDDDEAALGRVWVDGALVAFDLALRRGPAAVMYRGAWDRELAFSGAGWVSMMAVLDHLLAEGADVVDFGKFPWPYKRELSSEPRERLVTFQLARGSRGAGAARIWSVRPAVIAVRRRAGALLDRLRP